MQRIVCLMVLVVSAAAVTAASAQPPPLICFGNEPFWRLDLTEPGQARFSTPDSEAADYLGAANTLAFRQESIWRGQAVHPDGGELVAFLREGACSDTMSDIVHPYSVNVSLPPGSHYAGCCRLPETPAVSAGLENGTWRLIGLPGQTLPAEMGGNAVTVNFEAGRVHGFSGCNQFSGSYALEGEKLVLGLLGGTMMACAEPAMSIENQFLSSFSGGLQIAIGENDLTLKPENGADVLRFERQAPPRLEGVAWEVSGYNNGRQAVVSPLADSRLTLIFQDGQVSGSGGCNSFHGSFTAAAGALTIKPLATTRKACEEKLMAQEQEFLTALQSATTWKISRGMLELHRADGERVLTASESGT